MAFSGIIIGVMAFLIIGIFHPVVIKTEYNFGYKVWPVFLILGLITCVASIFIEGLYLKALLGILGFSELWSIRELFEQNERVKKGWFPENLKRVKKENPE